MDSGSNLSAISKECAEKFNLGKGTPETVFLSTFQNKLKKVSMSKTEVSFYKNTDDFQGSVSFQPYIMNDIMKPIKTYPLSKRQEDFICKNSIELADTEIVSGKKLKIDMLIGQDFLHHFHNSASQPIPGGSWIIKTWGGKYILAGNLDHSQEVVDSKPSLSPRFLIVNACNMARQSFQVLGYPRKASVLIRNAFAAITTEDDLDIMESFRSLELLGISPLDFSVSPMVEEFNDTAELIDGSYVVKLPTKEPQIKHLSNNFFQAFTRLMSGLRKRNKPKLAEEKLKYQKSFEEELKRGVLEKVEDLGTIEEVCQIISDDPYFFNKQKAADGTPICYLPHQCVYKQSNGKFRRVHDAKAKPGKGSYSLNDCLNKGPNLIATILQVLLGFRKHEYGFSADIEKAFPTVVIAKQHRDLLRCLWVEGDRVVVYRFCRLPFGLSCSPFILQATLRKHLGDNNVPEDLEAQFVGSLYMDDLVSSEDTIKTLNEKKEYLTNLFGKCGMIFRDWNCNHEPTRKKFAEAENDREVLSEQLVLGMKWDTVLDTLRVNANNLIAKIQNGLKTKRDMWKVIPSVFDPLGMLAPYVLLGKKIVMEACQEIKSWDAKMPQSYIDRLRKWALEFDKIESFTWPRFAGIKNPSKVELYGCCDASSYAMGGCIYLVCTDQDGKIHSNLILGKTRNRPSKEHSIPRLELISAVLLTNMMAHVQKVFKVPAENVHFFTDSEVVLYWLYSGDMSWKPFVANQVKKIKKGSSITNWHHISGSENPADLASRGEVLENLANSNLWKHGPDFWLSGDLSKGKSPVTGFDKHYKTNISNEGDKELSSTLKRNLAKSFGIGNPAKNVGVEFQVNKVNVWKSTKTDGSIGSDLKGVHNLIDISKIDNHSYEELMFKTNTLCNISHKFVNNTPSVKNKLALNKNGMEAEILWVQSIQNQYLGEFFTLLANPKAKVSCQTRSIARSHGVFLDRDLKVLRCTTRNENSLLSYSAVYPILLPSVVKTENGFEDCLFTKMLVLDRHEKLAHAGTPNVLSNLRSEFWILKGRVFVKKIIKKCVPCNRHDAVPFSKPPEPALPEFRVVRNKPFAGTGVDYIGPFKCRDTPKGKVFKAWYLTFVCGSTRAVHVEAVRSRKIEDFVMALSRFFDTHGLPESFVSDHEKAFKKSSECLEQISKSSRVVNFLQSRRISWNFYTERSPNKGGFIERLNAPIKKAFYKSVGMQTTNFEEFRSLAAHVSSCINDRPITYVMSEIENSEIALTPSMLLRGYNLNEPLGLNLRKMKDPIETKLGEQYFLSETIKNRFWRTWNREYLTDLFDRHVRNKKAQKAQVVPSLNEVVLIKEPILARRDWRLGRVVDIKMGRNNIIRQVTVQTLSPKKNMITKLNRSPEQLVPILNDKIDISPDKLVPLEFGNETIKCLPKPKWTKQEMQSFKKRKILPPYKPSPQFLNPEVENTGPNSDYVNKESEKMEVELELPRVWS